MLGAIARILRGEGEATEIADTAAWWAAHRSIAGHASQVERAALAGARMDRLGWAFASGYQCALVTLVPALGDDGALSLSVTEAKGGHPRAIETRLARDAHGTLRVTGEKSWSTLAPSARALLVVASEGEEAGRKRLRVVRVAVPSEHLVMTRMPSTAFAPEIDHARVRLDGVAVRDDDVLPGDGYERYVKPFRTVEDVHVVAAALGYVLATARRHGFPRPLVEELSAQLVTLGPLGAADPLSPTTHVALAGALLGVHRALGATDAAWALAPEDVRARWERDRAILLVASSAREKRAEAAWARLG